MKAAEKTGDIAGRSMKQLQPVPRQFMEVDSDGAGQGLFYFHETGDFLFGWLLGKQTRETFHYKVVTYSMKVVEGRQDGCNLVVKDGQVLEFPGNIKMRRLIEDHELIGSLVKIVFTGKRGRYKKYEVWKDKGTFYPNEEQKHERKRAKRKRKTTTKAKRTGVTATA